MTARERLLGRRLPPVTVTLRADFSPESDAAVEELESASRALRHAEASGADSATIERLRDRVEAAEKAMAPFVEILEIVPLSPDQYDDLVAAHPPTSEQRAKGLGWNTETFLPALLAACVKQAGEPVMSAEDWSAWAKTPGAAASGEYVTLVNLCIQANDRSPELAVKKGSVGHRNSRSS